MSADAPTCCLGARIVWEGQTGTSGSLTSSLTDHYRCSDCGNRIDVTTGGQK